MKAARWVGTGTVVCTEAPVPAAADGEILVRTAASSICGSDLHGVFLGTPGPDSPPGFPGHESVGEVVESRTGDFAPGDWVLAVPHAGDGRCLAEYQALPGSACIKLTSGVPVDQMLMAQQLGTVIFALARHSVDLAGKDVAVIGQGSAGAFFTFLARKAGARQVLVSDKSAARLAYGKFLGADVAVDANAGDLGEAVRDATGGRGADVVIEAVGSRESFGTVVDMAAPDATVVWFGLPEGSDPYPFDFPGFFRRKLTAYTIFGAQSEPGLVSFRRAARLIEDGEIDVSPLLSHMLPIDAVEEAFHIAHDRTGNALKVSIKF